MQQICLQVDGLRLSKRIWQQWNVYVTVWNRRVPC